MSSQHAGSDYLQDLVTLSMHASPSAIFPGMNSACGSSLYLATLMTSPGQGPPRAPGHKGLPSLVTPHDGDTSHVHHSRSCPTYIQDSSRIVHTGKVLVRTDERNKRSGCAVRKALTEDEQINRETLHYGLSVLFLPQAPTPFYPHTRTCAV